MLRKWTAHLREVRCLFRLYHQWGDPFIDQDRIIYVCQRCGKRVERLMIPPQFPDC